MAAARRLIIGTVLSGSFLSVACEGPGVTGAGSLNIRLLSGDEQATQIGTELSQPLVVVAEDAGGHAMRGQIVNFVVTSGGGRVFAGTSLTNADGQAQEYWTLGFSTAEDQIVEVRAVDPTTGEKRIFGSFHAQALPGPVAEIRFPESPNGIPRVPVNTIVLDPAPVTAHDAYWNPVPGVEITFGIYMGSGTVSGEHQVTNARGQATVGEWRLGPEVGVQAIWAEAAPLGPNWRFVLGVDAY